jgi:hypothetical protein
MSKARGGAVYITLAFEGNTIGVFYKSSLTVLSDSEGTEHTIRHCILLLDPVFMVSITRSC